MADYEAIVVGSGAGGLSAALTLAQNGHSVLLLEAMPSFGGYLNPFRRKSYVFDTGLHYLGGLGSGERFRHLLEALDIADKVGFIELDPGGFDRYLFPDYEFRLGKGREAFRERLLRDFPQEARGIDRFFEVAAAILKATDASRAMAGGPLGTLRFLLAHPVMLKYGRAPYQRLLDEVTSDRRLQAVLAAHSGTYGLPPARAATLIPIMVLDHYLDGAYYPRGGSGALRDALVHALESRGAVMKNRSPVARIERDAGGFRVESSTGEEYRAPVVISNADPVTTLGRLVDPQIVPAKIRKKAARLRPSVGAFYAFIGADLDLPSLGITNANIHHYDDLDMNRMHDSADPRLLEGNWPGFFITSPSVKDPEGGHAPPGHHTLEVVSFIDYGLFEKWKDAPSMKRGEAYGALKEKLGKGLVKAAERYIPGLSGHLQYVEYATPLTNAYWVKAVRGGCYGPEQTPDQVGPGRFSDCTTGIDGLFLAGAGTIGGGIMPCLLSGMEAAKKAVAYLNSK